MNTFRLQPNYLKTLLLLMSVCALLFTTLTSYAGHEIDDRRVLVLHEIADASPGRMSFSNEFFRLMREYEDLNINVSFEFLGLNLLDEGEQPVHALETLTYLAENQNIDLVLALLPNAGKFLLNYGADLFPDVPKVFVLPASDSIPDIAQLARAAVVDSSADIATQQTTGHIFSILPETERLLVVSGNTPTDLSYLNRAQQIIPEVVPDQVQVEYLVGLPYNALEIILSAQPANTAILMLLYEGDSDGNVYQFAEVTHRLSEVSPAPIFSMIELGVAQGTLGGTSGTMELYARSAAEVVLDIFNRPPEATYNFVVDGDTMTVFDAVAMDRWGISADSLPAGSLLINDEFSFWEAYRELILLVGLIIVLQSGLIMMLFLSRRRRIRAEAALKTSEERFRAIFDNSIDAIGVSIRGQHVFVNTAYRNMLGIAPDYDLSGTSILDYIVPAEHERINVYVRSRQSDNPGPTLYETRGKPVDGRPEFDMEVRLSTFPMDGDIYSVVFLRDISERKASEEALRISEERLRALGNALPDPVTLITRAGVLVDVFTSNTDLLVENIHTYRGQPLENIADSEEVENLKKCIESTFTEQKMHIFEYEQEVIAGLRWFEGRIVPMPGQIGGEELALLISRDITERKLSDALLQARLRLSEYAFGHSVPDLLQRTLDEAEALTQSKIGFFHYLEEDQNTLVLAAWSSNTITNMCQVTERNLHYSVDKAGVWADAVRTGQPVIHNDFHKVENKRGMPSGHAIIQREIVVPIKRNERIVAIVGVGNKQSNYTDEDVRLLYQVADMSWDIVQGLQAQISLKESEEIVALKDQFISMISHEFRTPMAVIQTSSDMLQNYYERLSEERKRQLLQQINEQVRHMTEMVTNTLTLSKSHRGIIQFVPAPLDVASLCQKIFNQVQLSDSVEHHYHVEIDLQDKEVVLDGPLLEHILMNLLLNASKYTPEDGHITLIATDDAQHLTLTVRDTGIGIPEDALESLFDSFYRAPNVGNIQGTGLGLAIVRQFVDMHRGKISVESQQGVGSTFTITLPKHLKAV